MRLEIYAANLRTGGAVVTTASLIDGIVDVVSSGSVAWLESVDLIVSPQVAANISRRPPLEFSSRLRAIEREDHPASAILRRSGSGIDVRYVVFGPDYLQSRATITVAGFADGTLLPSWKAEPNDGTAPSPPSLTESLKRRLKRRRLRTYDAYTTQTTAMAASVNAACGPKPTLVLPNVLAAPFLRQAQRRTIHLPPRDAGETRLFYPARGYPHKNHQALVPIVRAYRRMFNETLTVVVTLEEIGRAHV